ncbi:hypothetical protein [Streptomyces sp. NPDC001292]|uniref:hypothetical protein n=1 Tax=Streptomyces sp. NPDC001292 TaxID=3364558 RepID=UPI0036ABC8BE
MRALPSDFRVRTLDGVADDGPFTYEDLRPFYDEVTHHIGASGLDGDPAYPESHTFPLPPMPIGKYGLAAAKGMDKLGWHWWPAKPPLPNACPQVSNQPSPEVKYVARPREYCCFRHPGDAVMVCWAGGHNPSVMARAESSVLTGQRSCRGAYHGEFSDS